MSAVDIDVTEGRAAYARGDWASARAALDRARRSGALPVDDLELLARCCWWRGEVAETLTIAEEVYRGYRDASRRTDAAHAALRLSLLFIIRGDLTVGSAWLARARRLLAALPDGPAHGYLTYLEAAWPVGVAGPIWPAASVERLQDLAARFPDPALDSLSLVVAGMADLRGGATQAGFDSLAEAMLPVLAGDVEPEWAGEVYCTVIHVCSELADYRRMEEWTAATENWCRMFDSEAIYTGVCRVHRLELKSLRGDWAGAEARMALECGALDDGNRWVAGEGWYALGEIRRVRGDRAGATKAYAAAREAGIEPLPGEALLRLREGEAGEAWAMLTASLASRDRLARARLLRAAVEVAVVLGRLDEASSLAAELGATAERFGSAGFRAWAAQATGMVQLAAGDSAAALTSLLAAADAYRRARLPYDHARVLAWIASTYDALTARDQASRSRAESAAIFLRLGAVVDLTTLPAPAATGPLTAREAEVLEQVARGAGNREIATRLFISEKTVGRHLANIYLKLGVGSRTAAAAWWRDLAAAGRVAY